MNWPKICGKHNEHLVEDYKQMVINYFRQRNILNLVLEKNQYFLWANKGVLPIEEALELSLTKFFVNVIGYDSRYNKDTKNYRFWENEQNELNKIIADYLYDEEQEKVWQNNQFKNVYDNIAIQMGRLEHTMRSTSSTLRTTTEAIYKIASLMQMPELKIVNMEENTDKITVNLLYKPQPVLTEVNTSFSITTDTGI